MSITRMVVTKDINGNVTYGLPVSNSIANFAIIASTPISVTVPVNADLAIFSYSSGVDVFVNYSTTATLPTTVAFGTEELNPVERLMFGITTLSLISAESGYVTITFYELQKVVTGIS